MANNVLLVEWVFVPTLGGRPWVASPYFFIDFLNKMYKTSSKLIRFDLHLNWSGRSLYYIYVEKSPRYPTNWYTMYTTLLHDGTWIKNSNLLDPPIR